MRKIGGGRKIEKIFDMLMIWFVFIFFLFISNYEHNLSNKLKKKIIFLGILVITFFMANRSLGLDLVNYQKIYENFSIEKIENIVNIRGIFNNHFEPLYNLEMFLAKRMDFSFETFMLVHLLFPQILLYTYIVRNRKNMLTTYTIYLLLNLFKMDIARQFSSNLLYLLALYSKNLVKYIVLCLISGLMHFSNLLTLFMKPFFNLKWSRKTFVYILIITGICGSILYHTIIGLEEINVITFKLKYYLEYNQKHYNYVNQLHKTVYYLQMFYLPLAAALFLFQNDDKSRNTSVYKKEIINSQKIAIVIFTVVLFLFNAPSMASRLFDTYSIGFFLILSVYCERKKFAKYFVYGNLIIYNLIVSSYYLGTYIKWGQS